MSESEQEILANNIADKVYNKIAGPFTEFMANIEQGQKSKIQTIEVRIDNLETYKDHLEYVAKVMPTLKTIQKVFRFWTWRENWKKIIGIILATLIIIFALFWIFLSIMKFKGFVSLNDKLTGIEKIEADIRTGHLDPTTRGNPKIHYTDAQRDSIKNDNQMHILKSINERNANYKRLSETWKKQSNE